MLEELCRLIYDSLLGFEEILPYGGCEVLKKRGLGARGLLTMMFGQFPSLLNPASAA